MTDDRSDSLEAGDPNDWLEEGDPPGWDQPDPCGFFHYLCTGGPGERAGGPELDRVMLVREPVEATVELHIPDVTGRYIEPNDGSNGTVVLVAGTTLRYDQADWRISLLDIDDGDGWHRFHVLSGVYAGICVRIDGVKGGGQMAYLTYLPDQLAPDPSGNLGASQT